MKKNLQFIIPNIVGIALIAISINYFSTYGIAMFLIVPILIGILSASLLNKCAPNEYSTKKALLVMTINLTITTLSLILFALEGLICVIMAFPILFIFGALGVLLTHVYIKRINNNTLPIVVLFIISFFGFSFSDKNNEPTVSEVKTSITINAPIERVWKNVIQFPQLEEPTELIFKSGIAYPINATIKGNGIGAIRKCNFTTGSFIEPITTWNSPTHLAFDVVEQPAPMKEISYWDFDAPHLHDYFVSKKGEFRLIKKDQNTTELIGTTWYTHKIYPEFYWRIWSNTIVHQIHNRVLNHIKKVSEN